MLREDAIRFMGELGIRARELLEKGEKVELGILKFVNEKLSAKYAKEFCRYAKIPLGQERLSKPVMVGAIAAQWKRWIKHGLQEEEESEEEDEEGEEEEEEEVEEERRRKEGEVRRREGARGKKTQETTSAGAKTPRKRGTTPPEKVDISTPLFPRSPPTLPT